MAKKKIVRQWLVYAVRDLKLAYGILEMDSEHKYAAAFHAQQCAEKAAKSFLVSHEIRPPKTHDLEALGKEIEKFDKKLGKQLQGLKRLTRFAVIYRYPDAGKKNVPMKTIRELVKKTQKFFDAVVGSGAKESSR